MISVLRALMMIPKPTISSERAIEIAHDEALRTGRPWAGPVAVRHRLREYVVWSRANQIGGNVIVQVDIHSGNVNSVRGPTPR